MWRAVYWRTKTRVLKRVMEYQEGSLAGKSSYATEHTKSCHGQFDWVYPRTLAKLKNLREEEIHESFEINSLGVTAEFNDLIKALNSDWGNIANH